MIALSALPVEELDCAAGHLTGGLIDRAELLLQKRSKRSWVSLPGISTMTRANLPSIVRNFIDLTVAGPSFRVWRSVHTSGCDPHPRPSRIDPIR